MKNRILEVIVGGFIGYTVGSFGFSTMRIISNDIVRENKLISNIEKKDIIRNAHHMGKIGSLIGISIINPFAGIGICGIYSLYKLK